MTNQEQPVVLRGAHVIDPAAEVDRVEDVVIANGRIQSLGQAPANAQVLDLSGHILSPGWIDIHVHTFGTLGFADPDSIGIAQGVTTFVDAGGPGIGTLDEFVETLAGQTTTSLYAGCYISPMGIIGIEHVEGQPRSLYDVPVARWIDSVEKHSDLIRYLKVGAFSGYGTGPMKIAKGLAEVIGRPMYAHIGEFQQQEGRDSAYEIYRIAGAGDIVTHIYHGNACGILDKEGSIRPVVLEAANRGVLFDVGFGGFNFSWQVAETAAKQGFYPNLISSDLQQFNVMGPTRSLANVMSVFLHLGMPLKGIIERITSAPARALSLHDRAGSLSPGMPADITVFKVERGQYELQDTRNGKRVANQYIVPTTAFKNGVRHDCDLLRCQNDKNWILQTCEDHIPAAALEFSAAQRGFLSELRNALQRVDWPAKPGADFDLEKCIELHNIFHAVHSANSLPLKTALRTVFDSFLESSFRVQIGVLLMRAGRTFTLSRLGELTRGADLAA
jgi:dihydroorotase